LDELDVGGERPAGYRIDDLARVAGTTVRSLRVLHDRRLLPPPRLRGRTGYYDDEHLARVRTVLRLQERGHTLAGIHELLAAWEAGRGLADVLGVTPDALGDVAEPLRRELHAAAARLVRAVAENGGGEADETGRLSGPALAAVTRWFPVAMAEAAAEHLGRRPEHG
jgi:DNA-binding transcriptional MerR regulator